MKIRYLFLFAVVGVLSASNAKADIVGSTYHFSTSTTGNTQIASTPGTYTDPANPGFCVGPPTACGSGGGVSGSFTFHDITPTSSTITFTFFGSTAGAGPGSFSIDLGNFVTKDGDKITNITFASGSMAGGSESVSFNGTDAIFTGTTNSDFNAIGGVSAVFNVTEVAATPEPGSLLMVGTGLAGLAGILRRKLML